MLSQKLNNSLHDFVEEAEKQEQLIKYKDKTIQCIIKACENALRCPNLTDRILKGIIEEYKEAI